MGASRAAIASWVQEHHKKEAGPAFNAYLRTAIKKGLESGVLKEGQTPQRFRIDQLPKPKKATPKKSSSSKKKTAKKTATKKKTGSGKKGSSKKKGSKKKDRLQKEDRL